MNENQLKKNFDKLFKEIGPNEIVYELIGSTYGKDRFYQLLLVFRNKKSFLYLFDGYSPYGLIPFDNEENVKKILKIVHKDREPDDIFLNSFFKDIEDHLDCKPKDVSSYVSRQEFYLYVKYTHQGKVLADKISEATKKMKRR